MNLNFKINLKANQQVNYENENKMNEIYAQNDKIEKINVCVVGHNVNH